MSSDMEKIMCHDGFYYAAAAAYGRTDRRDDYMKLMREYPTEKALIAWFAMDAYEDLFPRAEP